MSIEPKIHYSIIVDKWTQINLFYHWIGKNLWIYAESYEKCGTTPNDQNMQWFEGSYLCLILLGLIVNRLDPNQLYSLWFQGSLIAKEFVS